MRTSIGQEVLEELEELRWHLGHLEARLAALPPAPGRTMAGVEALARSEVASLRAHHENEPDAAPEGLLVRGQERLRGLYKLVAMLESAGDWHSPQASLARPVDDLSPLTVVAGYNDYQRGYLPWVRSHEDHLGATSLGGCALEGQTLLFSSGMGAIQSVLQLLFGLSGRPRLLLGRRVYYETQELLLRTLSDARERVSPLDEREQDVEALAAQLRGADIVFVDTCTLDSDAWVLDFGLLRRAIARTGRTDLTVVADNTVMGPECTTLMPMSPARLFVVESALKHYQAGLDLTAAGLLTVVNGGDLERDATLVRSLETLRGTNGTNIHPYAARLLPLLPRELLLQRLQRQNRNAAVLASGIAGRCHAARVGHGGILFVEHLRAAEFVELVSLLALARGLRLVRGTSFGFNTTRVSLSPTSVTSIRFACGMERLPVMEQLTGTVRAALEALGNPGVMALCVRLSRFFPDYPESLVPTSAGLESLEHHLRQLDAAVQAVTGRLER
jgi:hypothetical protein